MELLTPGAEGPEPTTLPDLPWEALALFAVLTAVVAVLGRGPRRRIVKVLDAIAGDWERHAGEVPAGALAAKRFIRPALAVLRSQLAP